MSLIKACSVVLTQLCRICLKCKSEVMVDIFERSDYFKTESYKILKQCSNVMAHKNDKFPKYICWSCYVLLQNAWTLKTISEASYKILVSAKKYQKKRAKRKDYKCNDFNKLTDAFICELEEINAEVQDSPQTPLLIPLHWNFVCLSCNKPFSSQRESCPTTCDACLMTVKNLKASCNHRVSKSSSMCLSEITKEEMNTVNVSSIVNRSENKSNSSQIGTNQNLRPLKESLQIESEVLKNADLKNHQDNMRAVAVSIHRNAEKRLSVKTNCVVRLLKQTFNKVKTQAKNPCICKICGATFSRIDSLRYHMEVHDDTIHTCNICYNTYLTSRALYGHKKSHNQLKCRYCFKNYHSQQGLNQHLKICPKIDNPVLKRKKIIGQKRKINYANETSCRSKIARKKRKKLANSIESLKDNVSINVSATKESSPKRKSVDWQNDSEESHISNVAEENELVDLQPVTLLEINNGRSMCEMCHQWFTNKQNLIAHVKDAHI